MEKIILLLLVSCTSTGIQRPNPDIYYAREARAHVNGKRGYGHLVVPRSDKYEIDLKFKSSSDVYALRTCHREEIKYGKGSRDSFTYVPSKGIEDDGMCIMEIIGFDDDKNQHSSIIIDFEHSRWSLPATSRCNGQSSYNKGVTICQSKYGTTQVIEFTERVEFSPSARCSLDKRVKGSVIQYTLPKKECTFVIKGETGRLHKLMTIGYEKFLLRNL